MLISDYVSSNLSLFFHLTHFRELGPKYKNIFVRLLLQMKTLNFAFEINWPLWCLLIRACNSTILCNTSYEYEQPQYSSSKRTGESTERLPQYDATITVWYRARLPAAPTLQPAAAAPRAVPPSRTRRSRRAIARSFIPASSTVVVVSGS